MSDIKENGKSGQVVPVPMDEDQKLDDTQVQARNDPASALLVEEASNGTGNEKKMAAPKDMTVEVDVASKPVVTESEDQNSLESVSVKDTTQNSLQPEGQNTPDVKTVVNDANVNDACNQADKVNQGNHLDEAKKGNEVEESDKVNQDDKAGESDEGNEAQKVYHTSEADGTRQVSQLDEANEARGVNETSQTNGTIEVKELPEKGVSVESNMDRPDNAEPASDIKMEDTEETDDKDKLGINSVPTWQSNPSTSEAVPSDNKDEKEKQAEAKNEVVGNEKKVVSEVENENKQSNTPSENNKHANTLAENSASALKHSFLDHDHANGGNESGTEEEQSAFMKELENFFREKCMEFKAPKFYGEGLNCLKLWRAVMRLGGYDKVTSCKLWRQVGESFKPPKTCTTVSWTFRGFYEKALLEYERHMTQGGEIVVAPVASPSEPTSNEQQTPGSGRARRDAAARAMQGWHSQRLLGNGEVSDPIIKDKNSVPLQKRKKELKGFNLLKRKKPSYLDNAVKAARSKPSKPQLRLDTAVIDVGPPADWVKINVQKTKDCFEVYALVPGLLREEVRVQSDPVGRLVITGAPEQLDNPWGVTPFKKVVTLPSRIDPHQTSAVVTLHGQLFVRVPFEHSE